MTVNRRPVFGSALKRWRADLSKSSWLGMVAVVVFAAIAILALVAPLVGIKIATTDAAVHRAPKLPDHTTNALPADSNDSPSQAREAYRQVATWRSDPGPWPKGYVREPAGVAVDGGGQLYVVDTERAMVHVFRNGTWLDVWSAPGSGAGQLAQPRGVAVLGNRILVADTGNNRLQLFETDGRSVATWVGVGTPWDVAVTADRILVTDNAGHRVVVLNHNGQALAELGGRGSLPGQLEGPTGLAAWPDGRMAVVDAGNRRTQVWNADGSVVGVFQNTSSQPQVDVATYGTGRLLIAYQRGVYDYDLATRVPDQVSGPPSLGAYLGLAVEPEGASVITPTVWATFVSDDRSGLRRWQGGVRLAPNDWLGDVSPAGELVGPRRIAVQGDVALVADRWPRVQRFRTDGAPLGQANLGVAVEVEPLADGLIAASGGAVRRLVGISETWQWQPQGALGWLNAIAVDMPAGRVLALDVSQQAIHEIGLADGLEIVTRTLSAVAGRRFHAVSDLAVRPDGARLVVDRTTEELGVYDRSGALRARWPVDGVPLRVAAGPDNSAFVLTREGWIWKLAADGQVRAWWDAAAVDSGGRGDPSDLAVGPDGRVFVTDSKADEVRVYVLDPSATPPALPDATGCNFGHDKWASPPRIELGDSVGVSLSVSGQCVDLAGVDTMLVIDRSGSMAGRKIDAARSAALAFLGEIRFDVSRVGLVVFNSDATAPISLTNDASAVADAIVGFGQAVGGTDIGEGIQLAAAELITNSRPGVPRVMVMMTDGRPDGTTIDADQAAAEAKQAGIRIFAIGFGTDLDTALLKRVASTPADYFLAPTTSELAGIYTEIARRISGAGIPGSSVITDIVPANMSYLPNSAVPPVTSFTNNTLRWDLQAPSADLVFTYRLQPQQVGTWPTNVDARMRYRDSEGHEGELIFPVPRVEVWAPSREPTGPIYLPIVQQGLCTPQSTHADVALVIDTSSSMTGAKLDAAKGAARSFVNRLDLASDRAAIIGFNRAATLAAPLTGDSAMLAAAIDDLAASPGTAIDQGLEAAAGELVGPRARSGVTRAIVLLSDGLNNGGPAPVLGAAATARDAGIQIYAVAFGEGANLDVLREVAGAPERLYFALQPSDLERIYGELARVIGCR